MMTSLHSIFGSPSGLRLARRWAALLRPRLLAGVLLLLLSLPLGSVRAAGTTSFDAVTRQLDPGGTLFVYLSTARCLEGFSGRISEWRDQLLALADADDQGRAQIAQGFNMASRLVRHSGLESLTGLGISGIEIGDGLYRTKAFLHRSPEAELGYGATLFGRTPHPLLSLNLLPAETAYVAFHDVDVEGLWNAIQREVNDSGFTELKGGLDQLRQTLEEGAGMPVSKLFGSFKGHFGIVMTLDDETQVPIPLPNNTELRIPEPRLAIVMRVENDAAFTRLEQVMSDNPDLERVDTPDFRSRTFTLPVPIPMEVRPTIARFADYLVVASNDVLPRQMADVLTGKRPNLRSSPRFGRLAKGMDLQGNGFAYVDRRLGELLLAVQTAMFEAQTGARPGNQEAALMKWIQRLMGSSLTVEELTVTANTASGWRTVTHGNQEPAQMFLTVAGIMPAAVIAGLTLPAIAKAKTKAQSIQCVNSLKQMCLAARVYAVDHNDVFPPDFLSMRNELVTPKILFCPEDPRKPNPLPDSWEQLDLDTISYEYLMPGAKEGELTPDEVMFRCRFHDHTGMADGSVRQGNWR